MCIIAVWSQSLRYQVTPSDRKAIRRRDGNYYVAGSQSLRYQVTPSDPTKFTLHSSYCKVAIPSLSGHSFG